jgi:DUF3011 family protein
MMKLLHSSVSKAVTFACSSILFGFVFTIVLSAPVTRAVPVPNQHLRMSCASNDMRRHTCQVDTRGGVQLVHQNSQAKCIFDRTWGYDQNSIWVDRGCRADFEVGIAEFRGWGESYLVYCPSDDMGRAWCPADARFGVRLVRQRSQAHCILNETWGYGKRGIWVDRGCRADFQVAGDWQARAAAMLYCASDDMMRNTCPANTRDGVFIIRQRSQSDCVYNRTWGFDREHIWVDRGCRADFEIVDYDNDDWRDWDHWRADRDRDHDRDWARDHDRDDRPRDRDDRPRDRDDRPPLSH